MEPKSSAASTTIAKKPQNAEAALPISRIRTIMKSSLDTGQITNEVLFLMSKSTEVFVQHLTKGAFNKIKDGGNTLKYEHLSKYVQDTDNLEFLLQIVPQKIKVKKFKEILQRNANNDDSDNSSENSSSGSEEESS